jgi:hypothetical protein
MVQGGAQIGMGAVRLGVQQRFDFQEARLHGGEKGDCVQTVFIHEKSREAFALVRLAISSELRE